MRYLATLNMTRIHIHKMKIFTAANVKEADEMSEKLGTPAIVLMNNAGRKVAELTEKIIKQKKCGDAIYVICGAGNNGGDGLVAAKYLKNKGYDIRVGLVGDFRKITPLTQNALESAVSAGIEAETFDKEYLLQSDVVIDAIFGVGLKRDIEGEIADVIKEINNSKSLKIAVDIPSGVCADTGSIKSVAVNADATVTFQNPKLGNLLLPGKENCGELFIEDIGIPEEVVDLIESIYLLNTPELWQHLLPKPKLSDHKYTKGHVVVIGGDIESTGAAKLASEAALRTGSGLVTIACDAESLPIYATSLKSVMAKKVKDPELLEKFISERKVNTVIIGPGSGNDLYSALRVTTCLDAGLRCIIDADVFTNFKNKPQDLVKALKKNKNCVLTPHEGEFKRVFKLEGNKVERASQAAKSCDNVVVLKGNDTVIAAPDGRIVINNNAPTYLATAGSGDVLSGIIGGLLAQGMPLFEAACAGVYLHSETANKLGKGMIAEDIAKQISI